MRTRVNSIHIYVLLFMWDSAGWKGNNVRNTNLFCFVLRGINTRRREKSRLQRGTREREIVGYKAGMLIVMGVNEEGFIKEETSEVHM